jgi:hypothetical protein
MIGNSKKDEPMREYIDTAVTVTYRGYEIRDVSNAVNPMTGTRGVGGDRCIIKKGGTIINEQYSMEAAKAWIDDEIESLGKAAR